MSALDGWSLPVQLPAGVPVRTASGGLGAPSDAQGLEVRYPVLSASQVQAVFRELDRAREEVLLPREAVELPGVLGQVGRRFLDPGDGLRRDALELLPASAGVSAPMARMTLDGMARDWTPERLTLLLRREFPEPGCLDRFRADPGRGALMAVSPAVTTHVGSGNVPGVTVTSLLRALLVKSAALAKPGRGDLVLPLLFRRGLEEEDGDLARALGVLYWPGGHAEAGTMESEVLAGADTVVVYGGEEALASVKTMARPEATVLAYPHRWSVAILTRETLDSPDYREAADRAALAVAVMEQRGCVSPQAVYVEEGGERTPREWAGELARSLRDLSVQLPPPPLMPEEASLVQQLRGVSALREAAGEGVVVHHGPDLSWTVIYDADPSFKGGCVARTVRVHPVADLEEEMPALLAPLGETLQTVALEAPESRRGGLAHSLAHSGALRISDLKGMPWPPAWWHHDGRSPLRSLVRFVDLEGAE